MDQAIEGAARRLSDDECWGLLTRNSLARLAVSVDGEPDIFPVNVVVDGARVLFRTAPGSKLADMTANPRVALEVDEYDDVSAASVVLKGTAQLLRLQSDIDAADALPLRPWLPTLKYRWVRITPVSITGLSFARGPEPERYRASSVDSRT